MSSDRDPLPYLNHVERRLLGPLVRRLFATGNPRFERALESSGPEATARMACVNALRIYAIAFFALGLLVRLAGVAPLALAFYALAGLAMMWSFWCLYTSVGPEREHRRRSAEGPAEPAGHPRHA